MKLVIDIDKDKYDRLDYLDVITLKETIRNGKPLPKGHGRLIDVNDLEMDADWSDYYDGYTAYSDSMINCAPTIVEADKECAE